MMFKGMYFFLQRLDPVRLFIQILYCIYYNSLRYISSKLLVLDFFLENLHPSRNENHIVIPWRQGLSLGRIEN